MQSVPVVSYTPHSSWRLSTRETFFQPPPSNGLMMAGKPTWSAMPCQSSGNSRLRRDSPVMPLM
jgi:hypothetical protein